MPKERFEDVLFNLDLGEPPKEVLEWATEHIGETPEKRLVLLNDLREMIYEKGDVEPDRTDDSFLLRFLRARRFNLHKAYRLLVNYYTYKENNPEFHEDIRPLDLRTIGDEDIIAVLPYREQNGRRIMIYKLGNWRPGEVPMTDLFRGTLALLELGILEQRAQILGGVCVFDLQGISMSHAWQVTPSIAAKVVQMMVTCFPLRVHALHIIFESWVFDIIYQIFKPLLDEKMKSKTSTLALLNVLGPRLNTERKNFVRKYEINDLTCVDVSNVFFHGSDVESLHNHINPKYLPKKYGGIRPNYTYKRWFESFRTTPQIIKELLSLGYQFTETDLTTVIWHSDEEDCTSEEDD